MLYNSPLPSYKIALGLMVLLSICYSFLPSQHVSSFANTSESTFKQRGYASFYANKFNGRRTASGARFSNSAMTAAHRSLPFGSRVRVTNLRNGRSVVVRINDRGPWTRGRIVDLSRAAARAIGISGVGYVEIASLGRNRSRR